MEHCKVAESQKVTFPKTGTLNEVHSCNVVMEDTVSGYKY